MGKIAPDLMIDKSLALVADSNYYCVCSGSPSNFTEAYTTNVLAKALVTTGSFTIADGTSGRKVTMTAYAGIPITASGSAMAVALVNSGSSTLNYVTTCTSQWLVEGGTVDIPAWVIQIGDPALG